MFVLYVYTYEAERAAPKQGAAKRFVVVKILMVSIFFIALLIPKIYLQKQM